MDLLGEKIEQHGRAVLNFSGGKDSLATLELCKPYLDKITVLFGDTGDTFPHVLKFVHETMERFNVKNFVSIRPPRPFHVSMIEDGLPGDLVPSSCTPAGRYFHREDGLRIRPWFYCCATNVWHPMLSYAKDNGFTLVIRGQRDSELAKGVDNGHIEDGIEFYFPLTDWSEDQVFAFIEERGLTLPFHYSEGVIDSLDCMSCTAPFYAGKEASVARLKFMKEYYPVQYHEACDNISQIIALAEQDLDGLKNILEEADDGSEME